MIKIFHILPLIVYISKGEISNEININSSTQEPIYNPTIPIRSSGGRSILPFNSPYVYQVLIIIQNEMLQNEPTIDLLFESVDEIELRVFDESNSPIKNIYTFKGLILTYTLHGMTNTVICEGFVTLVFNGNEELIKDLISMKCIPIDQYQTQRRRRSTWSVGSCSRTTSPTPEQHSRIAES